MVFLNRIGTIGQGLPGVSLLTSSRLMSVNQVLMEFSTGSLELQNAISGRYNPVLLLFKIILELYGIHRFPEIVPLS